jgi:multiple sugar transport system permease protein
MWHIKIHIILPQILSTIFLALLLEIIGAFQIFEFIYMLCPFDYSTNMMFDIYSTAFVRGKVGMAAAKSIILFLIIITINILKKRMEKKYAN